MSGSVTIIDFGVGNIFSVRRAIEHCGAVPKLSADPNEIERSERVILPGVGAFADGMAGLRSRGLIDPIRQFAASGRPLLGICLGMQMLATTSTEFGSHDGLDLIKGHVVAIPDFDSDGKPQKIPYIGWGDLISSSKQGWSNTMFEGTAEGSAVYLVHSFYFKPDDDAHRLADYTYGGNRITAAVGMANVMGCQFHPEKSGNVGLDIVSAFLRI